MKAMIFSLGRVLGVLFLLAGLWLSVTSAVQAASLLLLQKVGSDGSIETIALSAEEIDAMPQVVLTTENEFVDGPTEFSGPLARDVLAMIAKPDANSAILTAANEYAVEIPISDFETYDVIFATSMNGRRLSLRDKGPIWVIYPMSQHSELRDAVYNDRLIWQLVRIEVR